MDQIVFREVDWQDTGQVDILVSGSFGYAPPLRYFDDFPVWGSKGVTRLGAYSGNQLVSHVGIQFRTLRTATKNTPIALIGAVATLDSYRGRGLGSALLQQALGRADTTKCDWTLLWGSEHDFYSKFGFILTGTQARARIATLRPADTRPTRSGTRIHSGLTASILDEFEARTSGIEFSSRDREWLALQNTVTWESIPEPFAFIAHGRGMDLKGIVHETGGSPEGVRELLLDLKKRSPDTELIGTEKQLLEIGFQPGSWVNERLCLARPLNETLEWNGDFWVSGLGAV